MSFEPQRCDNKLKTGTHCNISNSHCDVINPCINGGNCTNNNPNQNPPYYCTCRDGFNGDNCENDRRPCKLEYCSDNGKLFSRF